MAKGRSNVHRCLTCWYVRRHGHSNGSGRVRVYRCQLLVNFNGCIGQARTSNGYGLPYRNLRRGNGSNYRTCPGARYGNL